MIKCMTCVVVAALCLAFTSGAVGEEVSMDLKVKPGARPGTVIVDVFPTEPESASFHITISSTGEARRTDSAETKTRLFGLTSGKTYTVTATAHGSHGEITEVSPAESVVAP